MLHTFYLVDFTYTGAVSLRVASLGATPLNIAPVTMTKREGGYSAQLDVPEGAIAVSYQSTDTPRTIDINEVVIVGASTGGGSGGGLTDAQNARLFAIPTNPLLADNYVAPNNAGIAAIGTAVAAIPTAPAPAPSTIATAVQTALAPQLTTIAADAIKARAAHTNLAEVDEETATTTVFADNGTTPLFRVRTRDAGGVASVDSTYTREPVALT
jgi:hypothetical protein